MQKKTIVHFQYIGSFHVEADESPDVVSDTLAQLARDLEEEQPEEKDDEREEIEEEDYEKPGCASPTTTTTTELAESIEAGCASTSTEENQIDTGQLLMTLQFYLKNFHYFF